MRTTPVSVNTHEYGPLPTRCRYNTHTQRENGDTLVVIFSKLGYTSRPMNGKETSIPEPLEQKMRHDTYILLIIYAKLNL